MIRKSDRCRPGRMRTPPIIVLRDLAHLSEWTRRARILDDTELLMPRRCGADFGHSSEVRAAQRLTLGARRRFRRGDPLFAARVSVFDPYSNRPRLYRRRV